jgi:hypothetical protein
LCLSLQPTTYQLLNDDFEELSKELEFLYSLRHPNIVNFHGITKNTHGRPGEEITDIYMVLECCEFTLSKELLGKARFSTPKVPEYYTYTAVHSCILHHTEYPHSSSLYTPPPSLTPPLHTLHPPPLHTL